MKWVMVLSSLLLFTAQAPSVEAGSSGEEGALMCAAALARAGGDHIHCLLDAESHYLRTGNSEKFERITGRCDRKFDRNYRRTLRRFPYGECVDGSQGELLSESKSHAMRYSNVATGTNYQAPAFGNDPIPYVCPGSPGDNPTSAGLTNWGTCLENPNSQPFASGPKQGGCTGSDFGTCAQLPFPYYYLNRFYVSNGGTGTMELNNTGVEAVRASATALCHGAAAQSWSDMGSPANVSLVQIASIYKNAATLYNSASAHDMSSDEDCGAAVIITQGECAPSKDSSIVGCYAAQAIWQNMDAATTRICPGTPTGLGCNPDQSAHALFAGDSALATKCAGPPNQYHTNTAPQFVPVGGTAAPANTTWMPGDVDEAAAGTAWTSASNDHSPYMSACNDNYIGYFCHVSNYNFDHGRAFAFGGGQCSGGLPTPKPGACSSIPGGLPAWADKDTQPGKICQNSAAVVGDMYVDSACTLPCSDSGYCRDGYTTAGVPAWIQCPE